jgi:hypothetical protein
MDEDIRRRVRHSGSETASISDRARVAYLTATWTGRALDNACDQDVYAPNGAVIVRRRFGASERARKPLDHRSTSPTSRTNTSGSTLLFSALLGFEQPVARSA